MNRSNAAGFEGLSTFTTDIDGAIAEAERIASRPKLSDANDNDRPVAAYAPVHRDTSGIGAGFKKASGWVIGIGLILAVKACLSEGTQTVRDNASSSYSDTSTTNQDYDAAVGATEAADIAPAEPAAVAEPADDGSLTEPRPGVEGLTISEIRYCLAESIRIDAQENELEQAQRNDVDRYNRNYQSFNSAVQDFNSRCARRRVRSSDEQTATSQIEQSRAKYELEGSSRVQ